jgi:N-acetylglutamate synthase-like GNAT family acetyltransferase
MEMLNGLRPTLLQQLLEDCKSIKVKRLFLFMAEKAGHSWLEDLDLSKIDLGKGKRSIVKNGIFNSKYQITIPQDLANYE